VVSHPEARVLVERLDLEVVGALALLVNGVDVEGGLERSEGDRVVEVLVFIEPLDGGVVLSCGLHGLVDGCEVLQAALRRDELVGRLISRVVLLAEAERQPALLHLGVRVGRDAEICIDAAKDVESDLGLVLEQSGVEDRLQVRVKLEVLILVSRRGLATKLDVFVGEADGFLREACLKVKRFRGKLRLVEPALPVDRGEDLVDLNTLEVVVDELFPGLSKLNGRDALLGVLQNVSPQELLEELFTDEAFHVVKQLEAFFVRHVGERVVGAVSLKNRVETRVGVVEAVRVHVLPQG
jgi:hypothetical protein